MPLPSDERVVALAADLLKQFDQMFGVHPGFRAAHAKGLMCAGTALVFFGLFSGSSN